MFSIACKPKISNFVLVIFHFKNILWFKISVVNSFSVACISGLNDLLDYRPRLILSKTMDSPFNFFSKVTLCKLKDNYQTIFSFDVIFQLIDCSTPDQFTQKGNFTINLCYLSFYGFHSVGYVLFLVNYLLNHSKTTLSNFFFLGVIFFELRYGYWLLLFRRFTILFVFIISYHLKI